MPRGERYPEELRQEARRLRRLGWSLGEISQRLGPPKNTLTLWLRDIELTPEQYEQLKQREREASGHNRALAAEAHRQARLARIQQAGMQAGALLERLADQQLVNHIAAAMLYLAEGAKGGSNFALGNTNPRIISYWLYLLRSSFSIDESKFCLQLHLRCDQDVAQAYQYWTAITGITRHTKPTIDPRTSGKPTLRAGYMGVCTVHYYDLSIRRYLDALAQALLVRALDHVPGQTPA